LELPEQREQTPKADCVEAQRPALELRGQLEQTPPKADCVEAKRPTNELPEQQEQPP